MSHNVVQLPRPKDARSHTPSLGLYLRIGRFRDAMDHLVELGGARSFAEPPLSRLARGQSH